MLQKHEYSAANATITHPRYTVYFLGRGLDSGLGATIHCIDEFTETSLLFAV